MSDTVATTEESKRTRYTGPVEMQGFDTVEVDSSELETKRETVDLKPYEKSLRDNFNKNKGRTDGKSAAFPFQINTEALTTVKSRYNQAGRNVNLGASIKTFGPGVHKIGSQSVTVPEGKTLCLLTAGKRLVGRGRKPKAQA